MNKNNEDPTVTIAFLKEKIEQYEIKAREYQEKAESYRTVLRDLANDTSDTGIKEISIYEKKKNSNLTVETLIAKILKEIDTPCTSRKLLEYFNAYVLHKRNMKFNRFSGRLSSIVSNNGEIKKYNRGKVPLDKRYFYCLSEWFDSDELRNEYIEKIERKYEE